MGNKYYTIGCDYLNNDGSIVKSILTFYGDRYPKGQLVTVKSLPNALKDPKFALIQVCGAEYAEKYVKYAAACYKTFKSKHGGINRYKFYPIKMTNPMFDSFEFQVRPKRWPDIMPENEKKRKYPYVQTQLLSLKNN